MQLIKDIRIKLGLTQQQLADQLGIHRTQLALAEKGRRELPRAAGAKFDILALSVINTLNNAAKSASSKSDSKTQTLLDFCCREAAKACRKKIETYKFQLLCANRKLQKMKATYEQTLPALQNLTTMQEVTPTSREETGRSLLMNVAELDARAKLERCNPVALAQLEARIEELEAKIKVEEGLIAKVSQ